MKKQASARFYVQNQGTNLEVAYVQLLADGGLVKTYALEEFDGLDVEDLWDEIVAAGYDENEFAIDIDFDPQIYYYRRACND